MACALPAPAVEAAEDGWPPPAPVAAGEAPVGEPLADVDGEPPEAEGDPAELGPPPEDDGPEELIGVDGEEVPEEVLGLPMPPGEPGVEGGVEGGDAGWFGTVFTDPGVTGSLPPPSVWFPRLGGFALGGAGRFGLAPPRFEFAKERIGGVGV